VGSYPVSSWKGEEGEGRYVYMWEVQGNTRYFSEDWSHGPVGCESEFNMFCRLKAGGGDPAVPARDIRHCFPDPLGYVSGPLTKAQKSYAHHIRKYGYSKEAHILSAKYDFYGQGGRELERRLDLGYPGTERLETDSETSTSGSEDSEDEDSVLNRNGYRGEEWGEPADGYGSGGLSGSDSPITLRPRAGPW